MNIKLRFTNGHELNLEGVHSYDFKGELLVVTFEGRPQHQQLKAPYRNIDYVGPAEGDKAAAPAPTKAPLTLSKVKDNG